MISLTELKENKDRLTVLKVMIKRKERVVTFKGNDVMLPELVHIKYECIQCGKPIKPYFTAKDILNHIKTLIKCPYCYKNMTKVEVMIN